MMVYGVVYIIIWNLGGYSSSQGCQYFYPARHNTTYGWIALRDKKGNGLHLKLKWFLEILSRATKGKVIPDWKEIGRES